MEALNMPTLSRRFRAGGVTFCSLMPLRVIPFEVVCLLGMNEGDYPRATMRSDFDLMNQKGASRPGDRSRREDDRQLMLEALLSARRILYVSWCGRSVRDNSEQPPSVLVAQLRDYLSAVWGEGCVEARTTAHPLQPFSRQYFEQYSALTTYASEWRVAHELADATLSGGLFSGSAAPLPAFNPKEDVALTMAQLTTFLRNPVKAFFRERFSVVFEDEELENFDEESFGVAGLEKYVLIRELLDQCPAALAAPQVEGLVKQLMSRVQQAGRLPLQAFGDMTQHELEDILAPMLHSWVGEHAKYVQFSARSPLKFEYQGLVVEDWLLNLLESGQDTSVSWSVSGDGDGDCHGDGADVAVVRIELDARKLCGKATKAGLPIQTEKLLGSWVCSLVSAACGVQVTTVLIGQDAVLRMRPMPQDSAIETLETLLTVWRAGMDAPLPLPPKTAIAMLEDKSAVTQYKNAATQYEGGQFIRGEVLDMCLAREFPDFASLMAKGLLQSAETIYQPLLEWKQMYVTAQLHTEAFGLQENNHSASHSGDLA
jgi:exodeoxyribonuclease V gamma subunit